MENIELTQRGFYNTSFFTLFVDTEESIFDDAGNFNKSLNPKDKGTFVHEYIHYIQNVGTTYGLMDIVKTYELLGCVVNYVINNDKIQIPIEIDDKMILSHFYSMSYYNSYPKNGEFKNISYDTLNYDTRDFTSKCSLPGVILPEIRYSHKGSEIGSFIFGAGCIKESMAHLIQKLIDPSVNHEDIPYCTAEIITNDIYPQLIENDVDKLKIIVICYFSLCANNSGKLFIEVLRYLKKDDMKFLPPIELYLHLVDSFSYAIKIEDEYKNGNNIQEIFTHFSKEAFQVIKKYSGLDKSELDDIEKIFQNIQKIPSKRRFFIEQVCTLKEKPDEVINNFLGFYGTPHIYTNKYEKKHLFGYTFFLGFLYLSPIQAVLSILRGQSRMCNDHLLHICKRETDKECDKSEAQYNPELCCFEPWKRSDKCPFTVIWGKLGLHNKEIIIKK